jgi:hypothetical protein
MSAAQVYQQEVSENGERFDALIQAFEVRKAPFKFCHSTFVIPLLD